MYYELKGHSENAKMSRKCFIAKCRQSFSFRDTGRSSCAKKATLLYELQMAKLATKNNKLYVCL